MLVHTSGQTKELFSVEHTCISKTGFLPSNVIITYTMLISWPQRHQTALRSQIGWSHISRDRIWTQASNSRARALGHWPRLSCSKCGSCYLILNHIFIFLSLDNSWPLWFGHRWTAWRENQVPGLQQRDGRKQVVFPLQGQTFSNETLGSREPSPGLSPPLSPAGLSSPPPVTDHQFPEGKPSQQQLPPKVRNACVLLDIDYYF